ncbi:hypothetical protein XAP412_1020003 [Xanthomonas phaseoli pv. phaseoli]|uniref:Transposase n=1 Tax=Xanthomonas campestris pv. phaseoli TaxID=317013 RepID=A0ABY1TL60_XANCH|nr:hypothetical protein XAP412_1020003 [Xanthomonas phaseoli pv. phaseoli]SON75817.1 hypothetical protein XAP6984_1070003 [Xanthomonas phaseoli pv. phaseoli]SOO30431.1 hypothetical protein XAP6164_4330042 [Xanthomonas phaseoli pv. phaseoli]SOO31757.1 hypothetical protein XAP6164_5910004 [Xanthomonas phaseoli pv. phaseoli]
MMAGRNLQKIFTNSKLSKFWFFLHESLPASFSSKLAVDAINTLVVRLEPFDLHRRMK